MQQCLYRRCSRRGAREIFSRPCLGAIATLRVSRWSVRGAVTTTHSSGGHTVGHRSPPQLSQRIAPLFDKHNRQGVEAWLGALEYGLPPHLRSEGPGNANGQLSVEDTARLLIEAPRLMNKTKGPDVDLLTLLGVHQQRWTAVVWLVKRLVEDLDGGKPPINSEMSSIWSSQASYSLDDLTAEPIDLQNRIDETLQRSALSNFSFNETLDQKSRKATSLRKSALGAIWKSLGAMVAACTKEGVQPEVLEIIADLHHRGIMPMSIYSRKPQSDETAIQQPPTLHLLSSRILTSLSDAAWRAHEKLIVEKARAQGGVYETLRPELPGTAYRVNVAGLRPEVWLELILWSCLHGRWVQEGAAVLTSLCRETKPRWKPFSWRAHVSSADSRLEDWDKLGFLFSSKDLSTAERPDVGGLQVRYTVSSEVVNAYVDALLSELDVDMQNSDSAVLGARILQQLHVFRDFLDRSGLKLSGGSWDAVINRFVDSQGDLALSAASSNGLMTLSPRFGSEVTSRNSQDLPSYVRDGSAAMIGLAHRALRLQIGTGNLKGAMSTLRALQDYTDRNKRDSLSDFFAESSATQRFASDTSHGLFSSNYKVEFPAFELQLPATILGPLLSLVTSSQAYDVGQWLLHNKEVDGPLIPETLYSDPAVAPALIQYATATEDRALLSKVIERHAANNAEAGSGPTSSQNVLLSFLEAQFQLRNWTAAVRILQYLKDESEASWNNITLAALARAMIIIWSEVEAGTDQTASPWAQAEAIFRNMVDGKYEQRSARPPSTSPEVSALMLVLATVDEHWMGLCGDHIKKKRYHYFTRSTKSFNLIMEGVLEAHGVVVGRRLLDTFWPEAVRKVSESSQADTGDVSKQHRSVVRLAGDSGSTAVLYGGVHPDLTTFHLILRQAFSSSPRSAASESDTPGVLHGEDQTAASVDVNHNSPHEMTTWAIECFRSIGMMDIEILEELEHAFPERLREELTMLARQHLRINEDNGEVNASTSDVS